MEDVDEVGEVGPMGRRRAVLLTLGGRGGAGSRGTGIIAGGAGKGYPCTEERLFTIGLVAGGVGNPEVSEYLDCEDWE